MKSNKGLARKILCGLLAAGVVGVSGSALAATVKASNYLGRTKEITANEYIDNASAIIYAYGANDSKLVSITTNKDIKTLSITNNSNRSDAYGVYAFDNQASGVGSKIKLGTTNTDTINITANGLTDNSWAAGICAWKGGEVDVTAKNLNINVDAKNGVISAGIWVQGNSNTDTKVIIDAGKTTINATSDDKQIKGFVVLSGSTLEIKGDLEVNAPVALTTRGGSQTIINEAGNSTVKLNGDISFEYEGNTSSTPIDATVKINLTGADSVWNGNTRVVWDAKTDDNGNITHQPNASELTIDHVDITLADSAQWNPNAIQEEGTYDENGNSTSKSGMKYTALNNLTIDGGIINIDSSKLNTADVLQIQNVNGTGGTINTNNVDNKLSIDNKAADTSLTVNGTKEVTDAIASGNASLQDLADVVKSNDKSAADSVTSDANDIIGGYSAEVDGNGEVLVKTIKTLENPTNRAISDMANISLMTWRQENNDMNKRLGELRDSKGEHGAWARMARGESKYGSQNVKNQYNYYQVGYDEKLSTNPNWTVGVALTRTEGTSTFARGTGENKHTGFAVYGSYLNDNGSFVDLIAKYARMDNDYSTIGAGVGDASYETNGYSLSAEYGKRFTKDNGFWIEPQVELTYGTVGSVDYLTSKGARVHQDSVDSLVGRLGFSLGKDIKQGNVYVRASYLYDFDGETKATMSGAGTASFEQDLGGGWWEVGVGTNLNLSEATHLYFDVEKTYGGNVATPWQWNAGVRWSF
jgi:outer membrane autotransporter protein